MTKYVLAILTIVLLAAVPAAAFPEGYVVERTLWESDLEANALDVYPSSWSAIGGSTLFPADVFFKVVKDPVQDDKVIHVPYYAPGEAGNSYASTPFLSAEGAEFLLYEFDFFMQSAKVDANPNAGVYLFGVLDWPPHAEVYLQLGLKNVIQDQWVHYDWVIDVKANKSYLYMNGERVIERNFRTKGLDTKEFRVAIYGTNNNLDAYYDNIEVHVIKVKPAQ